MKEDRGELDLTRRVEELEKSLSIALDINDKLQRENKKLSCQIIDLNETIRQREKN